MDIPLGSTTTFEAGLVGRVVTLATAEAAVVLGVLTTGVDTTQDNNMNSSNKS